MSSITNCPSCQTQFIVTQEQLNQHNGKVRCGHCLHVFDARKELVILNTEPEQGLASANESASTESLKTPATDSSDPANFNMADSEAREIVNNALIKDNQASNTNNVDSRLRTKNSIFTWLTAITAFSLLLIAVAQSIYFLRTEIAIYYPKTKPYLALVCEKIGCQIDLPKKIDLIMIDDSDMQEDADYAGLIHLSSTLINQAGFNQAYPNIELTLTDIEDMPKLRRVFKPVEYLPPHTDIAKGLAAGEEMKVKLAITAPGESVAGYRVLVSY